MGNDPAFIDGIAMKPAAQMIADPPLCHSRQGLVDDLSLPRESRCGVAPPGEQELDGRGLGELGRGAEAAVANIEETSHLIRRSGEHGFIGCPRTRFVQRLRDVLANRARVARDAVPFFAEGAGDLHQHPPESRAPILVVVRREIRSAEEDFAVRRQKRRQRPAALATQRLDRALVASIDVRPLIPIDLDAHEVAIEKLGDARVLVRLAVHDVAPVAPYRADVEEDGLVLGMRSDEGRLSPREPVDGLVRGGFEVSGRLGGQRVQLRYLTAVFGSRPAPATSDFSLVSNVGVWGGVLPLLPAGTTKAEQPGACAWQNSQSPPPPLAAT